MHANQNDLFNHIFWQRQPVEKKERVVGWWAQQAQRDWKADVNVILMI